MAARLTGPGTPRRCSTGLWPLACLSLLLLPATYAMGGTLPAMERLFCRQRQDGRAWAGCMPPTPSGPWPAPWSPRSAWPRLGAFTPPCSSWPASTWCAPRECFGGGARQKLNRSRRRRLGRVCLPRDACTAIPFFTGLLGIGYRSTGGAGPQPGPGKHHLQFCQHLVGLSPGDCRRRRLVSKTYRPD